MYEKFTSFVGVKIIDSGITSAFSKSGNIWSTNASKSHDSIFSIQEIFLNTVKFLN